MTAKIVKFIACESEGGDDIIGKMLEENGKPKKKEGKIIGKVCLFLNEEAKLRIGEIGEGTVEEDCGSYFKLIYVEKVG